MTSATHDDPITHWIMTTMTPDIAAWALILTPGARFSIAPENLIGKDFEFIELRGLIERWGKHHFMLSQFEARAATVIPTSVELDAWKLEIEEWSLLTDRINEKITEFGA